MLFQRNQVVRPDREERAARGIPWQTHRLEKSVIGDFWYLWPWRGTGTQGRRRGREREGRRVWEEDIAPEERERAREEDHRVRRNCTSSQKCPEVGVGGERCASFCWSTVAVEELKLKLDMYEASGTGKNEWTSRPKSSKSGSGASRAVVSLRVRVLSSLRVETRKRLRTTQRRRVGDEPPRAHVQCGGVRQRAFGNGLDGERLMNGVLCLRLHGGRWKGSSWGCGSHGGKRVEVWGGGEQCIVCFLDVVRVRLCRGGLWRLGVRVCSGGPGAGADLDTAARSYFDTSRVRSAAHVIELEAQAEIIRPSYPHPQHEHRQTNNPMRRIRLVEYEPQSPLFTSFAAAPRRNKRHRSLESPQYLDALVRAHVAARMQLEAHPTRVCFPLLFSIAKATVPVADLRVKRVSQESSALMGTCASYTPGYDCPARRMDSDSWRRPMGIAARVKPVHGGAHMKAPVKRGGSGRRGSEMSTLARDR
ncbi:hypothetical protein C8R45DRAFT_1073071 [Mycena sanguinolenta]|nr:hypothetical protein C8R45DRAFT_1073071 [Mycena sanguinolenta]